MSHDHAKELRRSGVHPYDAECEAGGQCEEVRERGGAPVAKLTGGRQTVHARDGRGGVLCGEMTDGQSVSESWADIDCRGCILNSGRRWDQDHTGTIPVPPEIAAGLKPAKDAYDRELSIFVSAMRHKLIVHAGKGKWEKIAIDTALTKLRAEVEELAEAIKKGDFIEILLEAADVANWSLICFFVAIRDLNGRH